eukprot:2632945-Amphidinium_carterae.1
MRDNLSERDLASTRSVSVQAVKHCTAGKTGSSCVRPVPNSRSSSKPAFAKDRPCCVRFPVEQTVGDNRVSKSFNCGTLSLPTIVMSGSIGSRAPETLQLRVLHLRHLWQWLRICIVGLGDSNILEERPQ